MPSTYLIPSQMFFYYLKANEGKINGSSGAVFASINRGQIEKLKISLPPLAIQKQLIAEAEKEKEIITVNKKLIEIMERRIERVIKGIYGSVKIPVKLLDGYFYICYNENVVNNST